MADILQGNQAFSGFAVSDTDQAAEFYEKILGLKVDKTPMGLTLYLGGDTQVFVYPKPDHQPATFTILNLPVNDIDEAVDALVAEGVEFEKYDSQDMPQDEKGVMRNDQPERGPSAIAWFKDPSGNVLSILQQ